jgi:hypothetical protein
MPRRVRISVLIAVTSYAGLLAAAAEDSYLSIRNQITCTLGQMTLEYKPRNIDSRLQFVPVNMSLERLACGTIGVGKSERELPILGIADAEPQDNGDLVVRIVTKDFGKIELLIVKDQVSDLMMKNTDKQKLLNYLTE